jgi:hypothetical protein
MKLPPLHATPVLALVALSLSSSVVDVDAADIAVATAGHERNLGSGDFDFDFFEGLWEAPGYWQSDSTGSGFEFDTENALAVFNCTKTTNFPGDYCEVTIKQNSLWRCIPLSGPLSPSPPCTRTNPIFLELIGNFTKDQFDPETGSVVANFQQRAGFVGNGCSGTVSTSGLSYLFQLQLNAGKKGHAKSFSILPANSNTGEVYPPSSDCGSQNFFKTASSSARLGFMTITSVVAVSTMFQFLRY